MKKLFSIAALFVLLMSITYAGSGQKGFPLAKGVSQSTITTTYANSQIDTLIVIREGEVTTYGFGAQWGDSVALFATGGVAFKRVVNNTIVGLPTAVDTVTNSGSFLGTSSSKTSIAFANGNSLAASITTTPLWDKLLIIVKYAAAGNGIINGSNVRYTLYKVYTSK